MLKPAQLGFLIGLGCASSLLIAREERQFDEVTREQAALEQQQMSSQQPHSHTPGMAAFRQTAEEVKFPSGEFTLPGYLYKPPGVGPFPAVIWNHGSEKNPRAQPELARFYTSQGFVFFTPIRHGHGRAPGPYIGDLQNELRDSKRDVAEAQRKSVALHELYNRDVEAAVAWLKQQPIVDPARLVMSGVSYGGIQTVLSAEKGLGLRAFIPFAPGAMSFANVALRERLMLAARNAKAPMFLLQANNDYSTGPSEILAPILKQDGEPSHAKLYGAFGTTKSEGHGAFACWSLGATIWGPDVLDFIDAAMRSAPTIK
jgi:carboxymethylenebutenolidase